MIEVSNQNIKRWGYLLKASISIVFLFYFLIWLYLNLFVVAGSSAFDYFTDSYGIIAGIGGIAGIISAQRWGGLKSIFGRSLTMFSTGLLFQFLGQVSYAVYFYIYNIENSYPSFGEIFYFGSIFIYIYAVMLLAQAVGTKFTIKAITNQILSILLPIIMMSISYVLFLRNYEIDPQTPLITLLDFGYPLGQALFISLAMFAFWASKDVLGGILKRYVLLMLFSLFVQYIADSMFLYETLNDSWRPGGLNDLIFLTSYYLMGLTLLKFGDVAIAISEGKVKG